MAKKILTDPAVKFFVTIIGVVVIAAVLKELNHIFIPFVMAYFLFFLFAPFNAYLEKYRFPLYVIIIIDILITTSFLWIVSSFIVGSFIRFGEEAPAYFDKLNHIVSSAAVSLKIRDPYLRYFSIQRIISKIDYSHLAGGVFTSTFTFIGNILFVLFFFIFIVTGHNTVYEAVKNRFVHKKVKPQLKKLKTKYRTAAEEENPNYREWMEGKINSERQQQETRLANTFKAITEQIQRYIVLKIVINLCAGIVVTFFLWIFNVDFPIIWGLLVFLFNFVPTIGSAAALVLPVIMALLQFESITFALVIALVIGAIQTLFFNLIEPSVLGKRLNLNPLLILLAVLIWGYIWGIVGMLLAVPITAIIKIIISSSDSKNLGFLSDLMSQS